MTAPSAGSTGVRPAAGPDEAPELWPLTARSRDGLLEIGGVGVEALAARLGTPLYVLDEQDVRTRARTWRAQADRVHYAAKAFCCVELVRWIHEEGLHLDICSGGELAIALAAGMPADRIVFHGNNKSSDELRSAVAAGVGTVVVDCREEIERLARIAARAGTVQDVFLRVTPGIVAETHAFIATGGDDVKFGFPIAGGYAERAAARVLGAGTLRLRGIHSHLGSQILDLDGPQEGARRVGAFVAALRRRGAEIGEVDLGGGAGIAYLPGQQRLDPAAFVAALRDGLHAGLRDGLAPGAQPDPVQLAVEPGRAIVGAAGVTIYRVGVVKDRARRRFVAVDGGMSDAPRPSLYGAEYTAIIASREAGPDTVTATVTGKHCESGDVVVRSVALPADVTAGDLLAVPATGAYHAAMASNYNHVPRPAVVAVRDGQARLLLRRETEQDLLARDVGGAPVELGEPA